MIAAPSSRSVDDLNRRLVEAQATIEALLSGQIDAVVDADSRSPVLLAKAQDALRQSEERYRTIVETASEGIWTLDSDLRTTFVNRRLAELLGYRVDEMIGRSVFDFAGKGPGSGDTLLLLRLSLQDASEEHEVAFARRDGSEVRTLLKSSAIRRSAGLEEGTLVMLTDITERARAAERLQATEERTRFALQEANVGVWDLDFATGKVRWSEQLEAQYGLQPHTFAGTLDAFIGHIHVEDRAEAREKFSAAAASGLPFSLSNRAVWPDGTVHWLSGQGRMEIGSNGQPLRGTGISQDVTERRLLEKQNQQAQKMEAVGRLAAGVSHDFNNLLCVVLGWTELARSDLPADDPIREQLSEVIKAGEAAARLTKQLLSFSRQQSTEESVFNPNDLVVSTGNMLRRLVGEQIALSTRTEVNVGTVRMDRGQLDQVLMNLAVNARDAMPKGGSLTIETANEIVAAGDMCVAELRPGPYVTIAVTDTGTGMSEDVKSRVFEPFFTTKAPDKGTGLGLATSYGIVTQAGGCIRLQSQLGSGTTMKVYLPRADVAAPGADTSRAADLPRGTETVLLVDDELSVRRVIAKMLQSIGYRVVSVGSYDEALHVLTDPAASVQLVMSDVVLAGGKNGRELAERALALRPQLKVMLISGYTNDPAVLKTVGRKFALLQKPFSSELLGRRVRAVLDTN